MAAPNVTHPVGQNVRRVVPSVRKVCRPPEVQPACDCHLGEPDGLDHAIPNPEIRWVESRGGRVSAEQISAAKARLVDDRATHRQAVVEGQDAAGGLEDVTESRNAVSGKRGFPRVDLLVAVEQMQPVPGAEVVTEVGGHVVVMDDRFRSADESRGTARVDEVGTWYECDQLSH